MKLSKLSGPHSKVRKITVKVGYVWIMDEPRPIIFMASICNSKCDITYIFRYIVRFMCK